MHCNPLIAIIFLISAGGIGINGGNLFVSGQPLSCHKNCTKFGNCNQETGKCECPFGRIGKACEKDRLSACRLTPSSPAYCDEATLQSCDCLAQCYKYLCGPLLNCDTIIDLNPTRKCYSRAKQTQKTTQDGNSTLENFENRIGVPYENEPNVSYYQNYPPFTQWEISYEDAVVRNELRSLPLDECPEQCNKRGACARRIIESGVIVLIDGVDQTPSGLPECQCFYGFWGDACEKADNVCPNECSGTVFF
jgi:hypothetical protein